MAAINYFGVENLSHALEPEARLRQNVGGKGEVRVDAQGCLVHGEVAVGVQVTIVHLGLWGYGDEVVILADELLVIGCLIAGVCKDDGNGLVEEIECVQHLRKVWAAIDSAIGMCGEY